MNSLLKTVTRQRSGCDLNPGPTAPESSTPTTRLMYTIHVFHCGFDSEVREPEFSSRAVNKPF